MWRAFYAAASSRRTVRTALGAAAVVAGLVLLEGLAPARHAALARAALVPLVATIGLLAMLAGWLGERLGQAQPTLARLHERSDEYGLAEELGSLGSWTYDVLADRYHWSEGSFRVFGVEPELGAPSARGFFICVHTDDQQHWKDALQQAIDHGHRLDVEFRYIKDGHETIWVRGVARPEFDGNGKVVRLTGIAQDITATRRLAAQLADSEAKFRDLTQLSADWYWETDAQHRLSYLSESAETALGGWVRGWLGHREWELPAVDFPRTDWDALRSRLEAHEPFERFRFTRLDPERRLVHLELAGRALFDRSGRFAGYRGVSRDVTRERQQQLLLQVESDLAEIMRVHRDTREVVTALIVKLCSAMGWAGGLHLVRVPGHDALAVHESWGDAAFTAMLAGLPPELALAPDGVETRCWRTGKAVWLQDVATQPAFAQRYGCARQALAGAFIAPILDEQSRVLSALLFLIPVGFRADQFVSQMAGILSHALSQYLQRKAAEQQLRHASLHDALTGLPNRACLVQQLESRLARAEPLALLYLDLDRYKLINDTLGHAAGDQALIEVARRFAETVGRAGLVARMGGDEFVVLLPGAGHDAAAAEAVARRLLEAAERPLVLSGRACLLSASIGVALAPAHAGSASALMRCADAAMYQVKSEGRNGIRLAPGGPAARRAA